MHWIRIKAWNAQKNLTKLTRSELKGGGSVVCCSGLELLFCSLFLVRFYLTNSSSSSSLPILVLFFFDSSFSDFAPSSLILSFGSFVLLMIYGFLNLLVFCVLDCVMILMWKRGRKVVMISWWCLGRWWTLMMLLCDSGKKKKNLLRLPFGDYCSGGFFWILTLGNVSALNSRTN
jgi:hypothetical protein